MGVLQHRFLGFGVLLPAAARLHVHRAQLPLLERIVDPHGEAELLLFVGNRNQYLISTMPERTSMRSNSGTDRKNSSTSSSVQNPITRSTPARLYQLRSNSTISPRQANTKHSAGNTTGSVHARSVPAARPRADPWIETLGDAFDHAALAGGIAALENHNHLELLMLHPVLQFHQLTWRRNSF